MIDEVLHPGEVGVAARGKAELPARVVVFAEPVGVVEGRIGEDEVGAQIGMEIAPEGIGLLFAEIGFDAADGEVAASVAFGCLRFAPAVSGEPQLLLKAYVGGTVV